MDQEWIKKRIKMKSDPKFQLEVDRIINNLYRELKLERKINETECFSIQQNL